MKLQLCLHVSTMLVEQTAADSSACNSTYETSFVVANKKGSVMSCIEYSMCNIPPKEGVVGQSWNGRAWSVLFSVEKFSDHACQPVLSHFWCQIRQFAALHKRPNATSVDQVHRLFLLRSVDSRCSPCFVQKTVCNFAIR